MTVKLVALASLVLLAGCLNVASVLVGGTIAVTAAPRDWYYRHQCGRECQGAASSRPRYGSFGGFEGCTCLDAEGRWVVKDTDGVWSQP